MSYYFDAKALLIPTAVGWSDMGRAYGGLGWVVKSGPKSVSELCVYNRPVTYVIQILCKYYVNIWNVNVIRSKYKMFRTMDYANT